MTTSRLKNIAIRTTALGALLAGFAAVAVAQRGKPPAGPPVTTKGTIKSNPKADKGQATAESKRADARDDKAARAADQLRDKVEKTAWKEAYGEPKALLKGVKLSSAERKTVREIEKKYSDQLKDLQKQENAAEKAGTPDPAIISKIDALRLQERADLRAVLTTEQQAQYDKNVAALGTKKG